MEVALQLSTGLHAPFSERISSWQG